MAKASKENTTTRLSSLIADPIFAEIEKHKKLIKECDRLCHAIDVAENKAKKKYGHRPTVLITWRSYDIGGSEVDTRREELLRLPGIDRKQIEREYLDAKKRERAAIRDRAEWDTQTGFAPLREQCERAWRAEAAAAMRMAKMKSTSPAGAGALVAYVRADIEGECEWHLIALATTADTLASM